MAEWNRDTPWREGHLLTDEAVAALGFSDAPGRTLVIIATHDCDLAQHPDAEPEVEVVIGSPVGAKDGNSTHAKNARKLHLEFSGAAAFWGEFVASSKRRICKLELNQFAPRADLHLTAENHAVFQMWLASRYRRSAFADEFERRLTKESKLDEKIARAVKPHGELIMGVFFDVDEGEEVIRDGADDTYTLDVLVLHSAEPDFDRAEKAAEAAAAAITKAFREKLFDPAKKWQHIELRSCESISESVLTYQQFKQLRRWRLEHMSLGADPQQPVLKE